MGSKNFTRKQQPCSQKVHLDRFIQNQNNRIITLLKNCSNSVKGWLGGRRGAVQGMHPSSWLKKRDVAGQLIRGNKHRF